MASLSRNKPAACAALAPYRREYHYRVGGAEQPAAASGQHPATEIYKPRRTAWLHPSEINGHNVPINEMTSDLTSAISVIFGGQSNHWTLVNTRISQQAGVIRIDGLCGIQRIPQPLRAAPQREVARMG
jgi:hypothetical protein